MPQSLLRLWRYLPIRLLVAWVIIVLLPAMWRWTGRLLSNNLIETQSNSMLLATLGVILATLGLNKLAQFPGRRSVSYIVPILMAVAVILAGVIIVLRLRYSLYYLTFAGLIGAIFFFLSHLIEKKASQPSMAYIPLGHCQNFEQLFPDASSEIHWVRLDSPSLTPEQHRHVQAIVADLSSPMLDDQWQLFLTEQTLQGRAVYNNRQVFESLTGRLAIHHLYENELGSLLPSPQYLCFKQVFDSIVVLLTAPLILPICIITAILIRIESPGKVIFVQERVGQGGKLFKIYKFRSMRFDAEKHGAKLAQENDARVTKVGKFIRKTRIDELPQFINVLKGDMSLIGPRPEQLSFVKAFEKTIPFYNYRHIVKPGISGWAQVTQGYAGNEDETALKVQYDFYYIKHISFALDMLIVFKTIQTMMTGFGAR
ncbi:MULTISPECIES: sugar transferase [unclassified Moraxella]|uniref:sugar transferase n=1 Tax=unclassified Moraxella TaxID=2685852 RepID=UPI003AF8905D